jgi:hypothetical protein
MFVVSISAFTSGFFWEKLTIENRNINKKPNLLICGSIEIEDFFCLPSTRFLNGVFFVLIFNV